MEVAIREADGGKVTFRVKPSTKIEKIVSVFCGKKGVDRNTHRFLFDGKRLTPEQTVSEVGMEDGDVIDCMAEQQGGTSETNAIGFDGSTQFNHSRPGVHMNS